MPDTSSTRPPPVHRRAPSGPTQAPPPRSASTAPASEQPAGAPPVAKRKRGDDDGDGGASHAAGGGATAPTAAPATAEERASIDALKAKYKELKGSGARGASAANPNWLGSRIEEMERGEFVKGKPAPKKPKAPRPPGASSTGGGGRGPQKKPKKPRRVERYLRSERIGVSWQKTTAKWIVSIRHQGKNHHLGTFAEDSEDAAAQAFDTAARQLRGPNAHGGRSGKNVWRVNFPTAAELATEKATLDGVRTTNFVGVSWKKHQRKWVATIQHEGKMQHLGTFNDDEELEAARAYDHAARQLRGAQAHEGVEAGSLTRKRWRLNFPP